MSSFDQAFIKAYKQRDTKPAAANATGKVSLADAMKMEPHAHSVGAPLAVSPDRVLAALAKQDTMPNRADAAAIAPSDFRDLLYRVDGSLGTEERATPREQAVPRPHLTVIGTESSDEASPRVDIRDDTLARERTSREAAEPISPACVQAAEFHWPSVCDRLLSAAGAQFEELDNTVLAAGNFRQRVLAVASCRRGEGVTTVLLCLARRLLERGYRAAIVDADPLDPQIARQLQVDLQRDGQAAPAGELPPETIVSLLDGRLALLPSYKTAALSAGLLDGAASVAAQGMPTAAYDVVLVDLGAVEGLAASGELSAFGLDRRLDAAVLVQDERVTTTERLIEVQHRLTAAGIAILGVVQNCVRE
jgi:Mrp family chromosome partitioning ATPase